MHNVPRDIADDLNKDSYSSQTGVRPQDTAAHTPGEVGVEAAVEGAHDTPASQAQSAEETSRIAQARVLGDNPGGQG